MAGSLFQGSPQKATSYTKTSSETPKWMQDAVFNQINWAQNVANRPYQSYELPTVAELSPLQQQAYQNVQQNQGAWQPAFNAAQSGMAGFAEKGTADQLRSDQAQYLRQGLVDQNLNAGQSAYGRAANIDIQGAAQPYLNLSANTTAEALSDRAMNAANPYMQAASQTAASQVGQYMNPYTQNVTDQIAKMGARNLSENLLPGVSDSFIRAGQFGSGRMGEFGSRALRDTQESILNQQSQALQSGYNQAMQAAQTDLSRQGQLASTAGSIAGGDLSRILQGAGQYQSLGSTAGSLAGQQMSGLTSLGNAYTGAGQAQQQFGLSAAQAAQQAQAQDYSRQMGALQNMASMAQQGQQMRTADVAALEAAGTSQQGQAQRQLDAAKAQYDAERLYPQQQLDWLSTQVRGMAPITPQTQTSQQQSTGATYSASPLSQLAMGAAAYKGLSNLG